MNQPLKGQIIVVTGDFKKHLGKEWQRPQIEALLSSLGAFPSSKPSARTSKIIVGDRPGSKLRESRQYNTPEAGPDYLKMLITLHSAS